MTAVMSKVMSWQPFQTCAPAQHAPPPRAINTPDGVGDRLRAAAFAEIQAREAFRWAAEHLTDASENLCKAWLLLAAEEDKHLNWLLTRLKELGHDAGARRVSLRLWDSLTKCTQAEEFARYMASAEERGMRAGERFCQQMMEVDPISAKIFGQIAFEEKAHIELAEKYFPTKNIEKTLKASATKPASAPLAT